MQNHKDHMSGYELLQLAVQIYCMVEVCKILYKPTRYILGLIGRVLQMIVSRPVEASLIVRKPSWMDHI